VAARSPGDRFRGYLNLTPRQGTETLANWPSFRIQHLREEESSKDVRLIPSAHGLGFRSGRGSCVIDSYRTSRTRYREIACLVAGTRTSSVLVGAAPSKTWAEQAEKNRAGDRKPSNRLDLSLGHIVLIGPPTVT
jgi:hypothetical protein